MTRGATHSNFTTVRTEIHDGVADAAIVTVFVLFFYTKMRRCLVRFFCQDFFLGEKKNYFCLSWGLLHARHEEQTTTTTTNERSTMVTKNPNWIGRYDKKKTKHDDRPNSIHHTSPSDEQGKAFSCLHSANEQKTRIWKRILQTTKHLWKRKQKTTIKRGWGRMGRKW